MSNSTPKKKLCARLTSALFFSPTCVFVCDYFYLNKKNEAERHLGSGTRREVALPGFRPTIKNAVKFSIFFFASRRRLFFFFFFLFSRKAFSITQAHSLTSSPLTFPPCIPFCVCDMLLSPPPLTHTHSTLLKKKSNFFLWTEKTSTLS